ncbi:hypothetical protein K469DRAFT_733153 [Zopfia rhizophila CBS 207.26]|uniref:CCHC-type domain-containing protein n=1 Tax=Zopfia rhizophila CBS 207.26 TaxID=1314779 RepID=A0A6A6DH69_9PEZI|nr:hypothetical protein K469DRAFT_733153 [Zopfia rhizophila CBS 207.26]
MRLSASRTKEANSIPRQRKTPRTKTGNPTRSNATIGQAASHKHHSLIDTFHCTVDISRADNKGDRISASTVRAAVEKEICIIDDYSKWRCRVVTVDQKNLNRIKIACRNEVEYQLVKSVTEMKIRAGIQVLRDKLYPIRVNGIKRTAVLDENNEVRAGAVETFSEENKTTAYRLMVIYLTKKSDAGRFITEGYFHTRGESGTTRAFEYRPRPEQCYNCQEISHKAFQYKNAQRCARCAKGGHYHKGCTKVVLKCIPCGGPYESFSRNY